MASHSELVVDVSLEASEEARAMSEDAIETALQLARYGQHDEALSVCIGMIFVLYHDLAEATAVRRMVARRASDRMLDS